MTCISYVLYLRFVLFAIKIKYFPQNDQNFKILNTIHMGGREIRIIIQMKKLFLFYFRQ